MFVTVNKKFELSLSLRYWQKRWTKEQNAAIYGTGVLNEHGWGANPSAYFVFSGPIDPKTGMIINIATIKARVGEILSTRYDHKYLNLDTPPFDYIVPTTENIAYQLLTDVRPLFANESARPVACHFELTPFDSATAYADGRIERHLYLEFSAARRTFSPHLSPEENDRIFGAAYRSDHGHHYRLRMTLTGKPDSQSGLIIAEPESRKALEALRVSFDHKNLSTDLPVLKLIPLTTESLARFMFDQLALSFPVRRVSLWETPYFYAEYHADNTFVMGLSSSFHAAHRLHSPSLSAGENAILYGKCNNLHGHGHRYQVEGAIAGTINPQSGTLYNLTNFIDGIESAIEPWNHKHLDLDTSDFADHPTTGENIALALWPKLERSIARPLYRLRLWETPNNRFTVRKDDCLVHPERA